MGTKTSARANEELEKFFQATDAPEDKKLEFLGWRGPAQAIKTIKRFRVRIEIKHKQSSENSPLRLSGERGRKKTNLRI
jgi:hypothetical protein